MRLKEVVQKLVEVYTKTFRVNFSFANFAAVSQKPESFGASHENLETLLLRLGAVHRLQPDWTYEEFMVIRTLSRTLSQTENIPINFLKLLNIFLIRKPSQSNLRKRH